MKETGKLVVSRSEKGELCDGKKVNLRHKRCKTEGKGNNNDNKTEMRADMTEVKLTQILIKAKVQWQIKN